MLFGRNTTGGAVLLVPQRSTDKLEGYVEGSYGNHDFKRVQAAANLPLADTFRGRLGVDRMKREGYLHNRSGIGPDEFNNVNYSAARLSVLAELTPELENALIASYSRSNTHGNLGRVADCDRSMATNQQIVASLIAKPGQGVGGVVPINAGKSRIRGIEVESSIVVSEGLRLDGSYAYLDARIISITPPTLSRPTSIPRSCPMRSPARRSSMRPSTRSARPPPIRCRWTRASARSRSARRTPTRAASMRRTRTTPSWRGWATIRATCRRPGW